MTRLSMAYAGAEWLQSQLDAMHRSAAARPRGRCNASKIVSPLGHPVADVLGFAWRGLYHLPDSVVTKTAWHDPRHIAMNVPVGHLSTYDGDTLTVLVVVCFDAMLRLEISGSGPRAIGLSFHARRSRTGGMGERLPHLDDCIAQIRRAYVVVEDDEQEKSA